MWRFQPMGVRWDLGNVGGYVGPYIIGYVKQTTGSFTSGLMVLAATLLIAGFIALSSKE